MSDAGIQSTHSMFQVYRVDIGCGKKEELKATSHLKICRATKKMWMRNYRESDTSALQAGKSLEINNRNSGFGQLKKLLEEKINQ